MMIVAEVYMTALLAIFNPNSLTSRTCSSPKCERFMYHL